MYAHHARWATNENRLVPNCSRMWVTDTEATSFLRSPSWRFTPAGVIGVLSNRYEHLESIARGKVDSTRPSLTRVSLFSLQFNLYYRFANDERQSIFFPRYCSSRIFPRRRRGYNAFLFNRQPGKMAFDRLACFAVFFFRNYSGHLALIRCSRCFFASLSICFR